MNWTLAHHQNNRVDHSQLSQKQSYVEQSMPSRHFGSKKLAFESQPEVYHPPERFSLRLDQQLCILLYQFPKCF